MKNCLLTTVLAWLVITGSIIRVDDASAADDDRVPDDGPDPEQFSRVQAVVSESGPLDQQGFGRAIMIEAEQGLQQIGCTKLNLQVRTSNQGVVSFYEKLGYAVKARISMGKRLE